MSVQKRIASKVTGDCHCVSGGVRVKQSKEGPPLYRGVKT